MSEPVTVTPVKTFVLGATRYEAGKPAQIDPAYVPLLQNQGFIAKEGEDAPDAKPADEAVNPEVIKPLQASAPGTSPVDVVPVEDDDPNTYTDPIAEKGVNTAVVAPHRRYRKRGDTGTPPEPEIPEPPEGGA